MNYCDLLLYYRKAYNLLLFLDVNNCPSGNITKNFFENTH